MEDRWMEYFKAWSRTAEYRRRVAEARSIVREALSKYKCYVAFSGGKDSTCVLHLALREDPDVLVVHWDYGPYYMPRDLERLILSNARRIGARRLRVYTSELYWKLKRSAINVLGRRYLGYVVPKLREEGYECCLLGLREEEGVKRRLRTSSRFNETRLQVECYPIAGWSWRDVWAYIVEHGLPYLEVYDEYAKLIGYDKARLVTFFDPEFERFGSERLDGIIMWKLKNAKP